MFNLQISEFIYKIHYYDNEYDDHIELQCERVQKLRKKPSFLPMGDQLYHICDQIDICHAIKYIHTNIQCTIKRFFCFWLVRLDYRYRAQF